MKKNLFFVGISILFILLGILGISLFGGNKTKCGVLLFGNRNYENNACQIGKSLLLLNRFQKTNERMESPIAGKVCSLYGGTPERMEINKCGNDSNGDSKICLMILTLALHCKF